MNLTEERFKKLTALFYIISIISFTLLIFVNIKTLRKLEGEEKK